MLCDHFSNHKYGFGLAGGMIAISGLMLFLIPLLQKKKDEDSGEETDSAATEQQTISSGKQSTLCVEITGTIADGKSDQGYPCTNGVCNGAVKVTNNNFNEV